MSFEELHELSMTLRTEFNAVKEKLVSKLYAQLATDFVDRVAVGLQKPFKESILSHVGAEVDDRVRKIKTSGYRDPLVDFEASVVFIPAKDKTLALFFGEQKEYLKKWESLSDVKDYHYQNQTDPPKNISAREWRQREEDWETALPGVGIPALSGFTAQIVQEGLWFYPDSAQILAHLPSLEKRAKLVAEELLASRRLPDKKGREAISAYMDFRKWLQTDDGQTELSKIREEVRSRIKHKLTREDLLKQSTED